MHLEKIDVWSSIYRLCEGEEGGEGGASETKIGQRQKRGSYLLFTKVCRRRDQNLPKRMLSPISLSFASCLVHWRPEHVCV